MSTITDEYFELSGTGAKPLKWFEHNVQTVNNTSTKAFIMAYGMEGYGRYMRLLEMLSLQEGHILNITDDALLKVLAQELAFSTADECRTFIDSLVQRHMLSIDGCFIWSSVVHKSAYATQKKSEGGKKSKPHTKSRC